jgi:hypothetical protein
MSATRIVFSTFLGIHYILFFFIEMGAMYSPANPRSDELKWFSAVQNDFSVVVAC